VRVREQPGSRTQRVTGVFPNDRFLARCWPENKILEVLRPAKPPLQKTARKSGQLTGPLAAV
jgi:hypothetical protein